MINTLSKEKTILILFFEGFVSVSLQMLMMRQLVPFVGSSVVVSSLVVGFFLAALSLGYAWGGRIKKKHIEKLTKNLFISSLLITVGLSYSLMNFIFNIQSEIINNPIIEVSIYLFIFLAPIVFLLGQTVPLLTNFYKSESTAKIAGDSFAINTVGSVLGSVISALVFFHYLGMAKTIFINVLFLGFVIFLLNEKKEYLKIFIKLSILLILSFFINVQYENNNFQKTNAYNNYKIVGDSNGKYFIMNKSWSSAILANGNNWDYIERIKNILYNEANLNFKDKEILVLGAGGFTVSHNKDEAKNNNFTYVDIDPDIKHMAEHFFLHEDINGDFVAQDARVFVNRTDKTFDAVIVDLYSNKTTIPWHLLTDEFIKSVKKSTKENGYVILNIISDASFKDNYSRNIHNTINNNFDYCHSMPKTFKDRTNIVYLCKNIKEDEKTIYIDNIARSALEE